MWMIVGYVIQFISIFLLFGINSNLTDISRKLDNLGRSADQPQPNPEPQ